VLRHSRGSSFLNSDSSILLSFKRGRFLAAFEDDGFGALGFLVAIVPEPSTRALAALSIY
jgi:hypothetical protein